MKNIWRRYKRWILVVIALWLFSVFVWKNPLRYSAWDEDVSVLAGVEFTEDGSSFEITNVRDWKYLGLNEIESKDYFSQVYEYKDLENMYFYVQPLSKSGLIAHTFVVFEFSKSYGPHRHLGLSVEARREQGEEYSLFGGMLNKFEITHTWATEKDLVDRRTVYMDYGLKRYKVLLKEKDQQVILKAFLDPTKALADKPRFYNTLTYNCANALASYVSQIAPGTMPFHYSFILTGKSGEYLEKLGYLKFEKNINL